MEAYQTSGTSPTFERLRHNFELRGFTSVRLDYAFIGLVPRGYILQRKASATWLVNTAARPATWESKS